MPVPQRSLSRALGAAVADSVVQARRGIPPLLSWAGE